MAEYADPRAAIAAAIERNNANAEMLRARGMMNLANSRGAFYSQLGMQATGMAADMLGGMRNAGAIGSAAAGPALDFSSVLQANPYAAQQGLLATTWTAYGQSAGLPFSRFAGQMMSMNATVAQEQARTFLNARMSDIWRGGVSNLASVFTFGAADYYMRAAGTEVGFGGNRQLARDVVMRQFRGFTGREIGGDVSALGYGLGEAATERTVSQILQSDTMRGLQRRTGFAGAQLLELADIAGQTAIPGQAVQGGVAGRIKQLTGGAGQVLDVMRTLGMDSQELQGYMQAMDQVYTNLDDLQGLAKESTRLRRSTRIDHRVLLQGLAQAREVTRGAFMGMEEGGGVFSGLTQIYQQQIESGAMPTSEILRFGGRQQAAAAMAMARYRQNVAMVQGGAGRDFVTLAAADPAALSRLGGGGMNILQFGAAVGGAIAADPFAALKAQTNQVAMRNVSANLDFYQWRRAQAGRPFYIDPIQETQQFAQSMGMSMAEAATRRRMLENEQTFIGSTYGVDATTAGQFQGRLRDLSARGMLGIFNETFTTTETRKTALERMGADEEGAAEFALIGGMAAARPGATGFTPEQDQAIRSALTTFKANPNQSTLQAVRAVINSLPDSDAARRLSMRISGLISSTGITATKSIEDRRLLDKIGVLAKTGFTVGLAQVKDWWNGTTTQLLNPNSETAAAWETVAADFRQARIGVEGDVAGFSDEALATLDRLSDATQAQKLLTAMAPRTVELMNRAKLGGLGKGFLTGDVSNLPMALQAQIEQAQKAMASPEQMTAMLGQLTSKEREALLSNLPQFKGADFNDPKKLAETLAANKTDETVRSRIQLSVGVLLERSVNANVKRGDSEFMPMFTQEVPKQA